MLHTEKHAGCADGPELAVSGKRWTSCDARHFEGCMYTCMYTPRNLFFFVPQTGVPRFKTNEYPVPSVPDRDLDK